MNGSRWPGFLFGVLLASAGTAHAATPGIKPGLWEVHVKTVLPGMPFAPPPQTMKHCVRPAEARQGWRGLQSGGNKDCRFTDVKIESNRVQWRMRCTGKTAVEGKGHSVIDSPKRYHGVSDLVSHSGGESFTMHIETTGRWIGACR